MPVEVRLQLHLPPGMSIDDVRHTLVQDNRGFIETGIRASDETLYTAADLAVEVGLLVVNAPVGAKYLLDLLAILRKKSAETSPPGGDNALIVDGVRYPLAQPDAKVLRELLE